MFSKKRETPKVNQAALAREWLEIDDKIRRLANQAALLQKKMVPGTYMVGDRIVVVESLFSSYGDMKGMPVKVKEYRIDERI